MFPDDETLEAIIYEGIQRLVAKRMGQVECFAHHELLTKYPAAFPYCPACRATL